MNVVAIDPSLSNTAVCVYDGTTADTQCFPTKAVKGLQGRINRFRTVVEAICLKVAHAVPRLVAIEGYGFCSQKANVQGEFGGILRDRLGLALPNNLLHVAEVAPATVKKFATGKGNAKKIHVVAAIVKRYGVEFKTDDEYDAYALARLAACVAGMKEPQNAKQREAVETVLKSYQPTGAKT